MLSFVSFVFAPVLILLDYPNVFICTLFKGYDSCTLLFLFFVIKSYHATSPVISKHFLYSIFPVFHYLYSLFNPVCVFSDLQYRPWQRFSSTKTLYCTELHIDPLLLFPLMGKVDPNHASKMPFHNRAINLSVYNNGLLLCCLNCC